MADGSSSRIIAAYGAFRVTVLVLIGACAVWLFVPVPIPIPTLHSPLLTAFEDSNARVRSRNRIDGSVESSTVVEVFPVNSTLAAAETLLRHEWFSCGALEPADERLGARYRYFERCTRLTAFHPLGRFGWVVTLFVDRNGVIQETQADRYYDGV
jgi:hypothetical protein